MEHDRRFANLPHRRMLAKKREDRMIRDEDEKPLVEPLNLEKLGIEELRRYIAGLQAEILRAEAEIGRKQAHRTGAEALFRR